MVQKKIIELIEKYNVIIIHHHINPDPDCIGSQLGLKYLLENSYPDKEIYAVGKHTDKTEFLGKLDEIPDDKYMNALVIIVDVGDKLRVDDNRFLNGKALIKIDHHPLACEFADIEWIDTTFASATEMIIDLYVQNQDKLILTEAAARVLYAGMLTDTGRFYFDSVSSQTLNYGAMVYKYNFDKQALYADIYYQSIAELKFRGYILNNFKSTPSGLGYIKLNHELLEEFNIAPDYASTLVNSLANIKDIIMWLFFIEYIDRGNIRVEFRSRGPVVNELAKSFGGGGHKLASGAIVSNWETVDEIINKASEVCSDYHK